MSWRHRAACRGLPVDLFHPAPGEHRTTAEARAVCARCPVRQPCLATALADPTLHGVWGGTTGQERKRLRRAERVPRSA